MEKYFNWEPRAVVCRRGSMANPSYDAELAFGDKHWVISVGHKEHEEAKASAQQFVDILQTNIKATVEIEMVLFKRAKP